MGQRVLPKIAHQAMPGTFLVRQQDAGRTQDAARGGSLAFEKESVGLVRIADSAEWSLRGNPGASLVVWVNRIHYSRVAENANNEITNLGAMNPNDKEPRR
jgi:hypothetical protein